MQKKNRVAWIDAVRGVGILAVVLFHTGFLPFINISDPILMSFMLPVFLFTGGWLARDTPLTWARFFPTVRRLLTPFFLAGGVSFAFWLLVRTRYPQGVLLQPLGGELAKWLTGRNPYFDSPLWFIPTYLFATVLMHIIAPWWGRRDRVTQCLLGLDFVLVGLILAREYVYLVFSYDLVALFIGMMMLGSVASKVCLPRYLQTAWSDAAATCLFVAIALVNGYIDMFQRQFGNGFLYILSAVLGTYAVARLAVRGLAAGSRVAHWLATLGRSSMTVLVWHWPLMQWLTYGFYTVGILTPLASSYTKTSFTLGVGGGEHVVLQLVFCTLYAAISLFMILGAKGSLQGDCL